MINRFVKIAVIIFSFIFLTGFIPIIALIGPGYTVATSGSFYKAGAQYFFNKSIKDTTGKNSLEFFGDKIKKNNKNELNHELEQLVKRRIELARKKLNLKNINQ